MYYTTISGSLRKFLKEISDYYLEFESHGVKVLSPKISKIKNPDDQFIYFEEDGNKPIKYIEKNHLLNIAQSDFLFVVNPNGYIGNSTLLEIGYALAKNIKIFSSEVFEDDQAKQKTQFYEILRLNTNIVKYTIIFLSSGCLKI